MPFAVEQDVQALWQEVRIASVAGTPDDKLCAQYGITESALRARRCREKWPTSRRLRIEQQEARRALKNKDKNSVQSSHGAESVAHPATSIPKAVDVVVQSLDEQVNEFVGVVVPALLKQGRESVTRSPESFGAKDNGDLSKLISNVWKLTGRDKPTAEVNLSLWTTQTTQPERDVTPSSASDVEDEMLG